MSDDGTDAGRQRRESAVAQTATAVELLLVSGEKRRIELPSHSGSLVAALDRLQPWIATLDGTWVQKRYVVEVRALGSDDGH